MDFFYKDDLAYIHDAGFGDLAKNAAPFLLEVLRQKGINSSFVVGATRFCEVGSKTSDR
ncbi:hypothetical protein [Nodularia sp. LEGE 04288]|uniref:hypothetical protein n=1 Tax=Nodularia sp. LEGE 04288 TaxID=1828639 RepID=UPI001D0FA4BF|nr:hypothetical protein [Nodularia sp. LEGE 04288]MCC2696065.1 hypothetical protein [Nodularia sp. LEGE 04288]